MEIEWIINDDKSIVIDGECYQIKINRKFTSSVIIFFKIENDQMYCIMEY